MSEKDGSYVRSIVAMINEAEPSSPPWPAAGRESTPPRTPPSYLSVSRSNNGYNNSLLYNIDQRKDKNKESYQQSPHVNGNGTASENIGTQYVSLSQMIGPKSKSNSKYSDLGLQLKSPEKNCKSFLRNINSFEKIGKQNSSERSPDRPTVTMVGQKMQHLLHLESSHPSVPSHRNPETTPAGGASALQSNELAKVAIDVPDRASLIDPQIDQPKRPELENAGITFNPSTRKQQKFREIFKIPRVQGVPHYSSIITSEMFSDKVLKIVGLEEPNENYEAPPNDLAGQHFRKIATEQKERLLTLANLIDKQLETDSLIPDEVQGIMRCASGKANLIVRERFRQFDDLCEDNLNPKTNKMTPGPADLAGFWDMVMIEVNSIFTSFRDIAKAALDNWTMPPKESVPRPAAKTSTPRSTGKKKPIQNKKSNIRRIKSSQLGENEKGTQPQR